MPDTAALSIAQQALQLRRDYPKCKALEALDAAFEGRHGAKFDFGGLTDSREPFGQLVAEAFDTGMEPGDWLGLMDANALPQVTTMRIWRTYVLSRFESRYCLTPRDN